YMCLWWCRRHVRPDDIRHSAFNHIFQKFQGRLAPANKRTFFLGIPLGAPPVNHFLCDASDTWEVLRAVSVEVQKRLGINFIPVIGCYPVFNEGVKQRSPFLAELRQVRSPPPPRETSPTQARIP